MNLPASKGNMALIIKKNDVDSAEKTAQYLSEGKITIIPTDTVYGFSGIVDLSSNKNIYETDSLIRSIKGREENKPLIQLISSVNEIEKYADEEMPLQLKKYWPGALTVILKCKNELFRNNYNTIAFRCPGDLWLRQVISFCDAPVFSTSVNKSGCPVLDNIPAIVKEFSSQVSLIVDDGERKKSIPSTLVKIEDGKIVVLRQGAVKID
jgi:L-threonylcarbamoyladenylate synthase